MFKQTLSPWKSSNSAWWWALVHIRVDTSFWHLPSTQKEYNSFNLCILGTVCKNLWEMPNQIFYVHSVISLLKIIMGHHVNVHQSWKRGFSTGICVLYNIQFTFILWQRYIIIHIMPVSSQLVTWPTRNQVNPYPGGPLVTTF